VAGIHLGAGRQRWACMLKQARLGRRVMLDRAHALALRWARLGPGVPDPQCPAAIARARVRVLVGSLLCNGSPPAAAVAAMGTKPALCCARWMGAASCHPCSAGHHTMPQDFHAPLHRHARPVLLSNGGGDARRGRTSIAVAASRRSRLPRCDGTKFESVASC
jgi:hypothetical protein